MLGKDIKGQNTPVRYEILDSPTKLTERSVMDKELETDKIKRVLMI